MAAMHIKGKSGLSCLDVLAASGYVWGAADGEAGESRVAGEAESLTMMPLGILLVR